MKLGIFTVVLVQRFGCLERVVCCDMPWCQLLILGSRYLEAAVDELNDVDEDEDNDIWYFFRTSFLAFFHAAPKKKKKPRKVVTQNTQT